MNIYFSKVIKAGERQREFNFRQHTHTTTDSYAIDVPDDKGQRIAFRMDKDANGTWKTAEQELPTWIQGVETALNEAILEHLISLSPLKRK
ncbi:MAG TPA: hypothetical protein VD794_04990 [Flavisolibacter sp.]|nr:hypothetical protein [Flavisolibacter sp.]